MEYAKFKKEPPYIGYTFYYMDNIEMCLLGNFLSSDVCSNASSFKDWFYSDYETTGSNITYLEKEGDEIWLSDFLSEEDPPLHYCKLTRKQFIYILDTWEKLYKQSPEEIIITKDGDTIKMEGKGQKKNYFFNLVHWIWTDLLKKIKLQY